MQLEVTATIFLMFVLPRCSTEICGLQITERMKNRSITLRNIDIKLCETECSKVSFMFASCREAKKTGESRDHSTNRTKIRGNPCPSKHCNLTSHCSETGCERGCEKPTLTSVQQAEDELHQACETGNISAVWLVLCQKHVDINCNQSGWTPVMRAARMGHLDVMKLLVRIGANTSLTDTDGDNILHLSCNTGYLELVRYVLSLNVVDINTRGWKRKTPVMMAAEVGYTEVVKLLVKNGANVSLVNVDGNNMLHLPCHGRNMEVVRYIIFQGLIDINSRGQKGKTPVMLAAEEGDREIVEFLLSKGADAVLVDEDGNNVLHVACENESVDVAQYILSQNLVNIEAKNSRGQTAVMIAREHELTGLFDHL